MNSPDIPANYAALARKIKCWGRELGFQQVGISDTGLVVDEQHLEHWLQQGYHGEMHFMTRHGRKRSRPQALVPGTLRVISVRMDYLPAIDDDPQAILGDPTRAYLSRYALGRDYHKLMRQRLRKLTGRIQECIGAFDSRAFVDSAPVMEKALAVKSGLGWRGKHSILISRDAGSHFFLGELFTSLPLPVDAPTGNHCGTCRHCMDDCPTGAIIAPYRLDARRCISYLTIELAGAIPRELRPLLGNRIYGCDDCQLVCPWNRFARLSAEKDFLPRQGLEAPQLVQLFAWSEEEFLRRTEGSAIRRIGHLRWLRNIAVALGNAPTAPPVIAALRSRAGDASPLVREHVEWALEQHDNRP